MVEDEVRLAETVSRGLFAEGFVVDLEDLVNSEADRLRKSGKLTVTVEAPPVRMRGDPVQLARVLRNLADNAARHAESHIDLRLQTVGETVMVEVEDDGPGIREADRERIFERFVRLDESRTRTSGGVGLGLAIAREIGRAHGGSLHVESGDRGARFVLFLPARVTRSGGYSRPWVQEGACAGSSDG